MKDIVEALVNKIPARWLKTVVVLLIVALGSNAWAAYAAQKAGIEQGLSLGQQNQQDIRDLVSLVKGLTDITRLQQEELKGYREEVRELRKEQVDWALQAAKTLKTIEKGGTN